MPAKDPAVSLPSNEPSPTHSWLARDARQLETKPGEPVLHRFCTACHRNFVHDISSGEWYAAFPGVFDFERLDEVSSRWLSEECPGERLITDELARKSPPRR